MFSILQIDDREVKGRYIVLSKQKAHFFSEKVFGLLFKFKNRFFILDRDEWNFIIQRVARENKNKEKRVIERVIASRTFKVKLKTRRRILIPKKFRKN